MWWVELVVALWLFAMGTVVGSFLNVCIYRIPWQKSVIWPGSHCPSCLSVIRARDNVPILGWLILKGRCHTCASRISPRYPLIEALTGVLFVAVYAIDVHWGAPVWAGANPYASVAYHTLFVSLLIAATFIDYDLYILPDAITVTGMVLGVSIGALIPEARLDPSAPAVAVVTTYRAGLIIGVQGLLIGGALVWVVRIVFGALLRREAMGFGDVMLLAMIGAFLGWQAAVLAFFLGAFYALAHALGKAVRSITKWLRGVKLKGSDHEIPFGPYLSMAALTLMLGWPWIWWGWAKGFLENLAVAFWFLIGRDTGL
jgi:leader peptidase (prepilin peptidase) / N-methyltransferase